LKLAIIFKVFRFKKVSKFCYFPNFFHLFLEVKIVEHLIWREEVFFDLVSEYGMQKSEM